VGCKNKEVTTDEIKKTKKTKLARAKWDECAVRRR